MGLGLRVVHAPRAILKQLDREADGRVVVNREQEPPATDLVRTRIRVRVRVSVRVIGMTVRARGPISCKAYEASACVGDGGRRL